jgi:hypothetical protein
MRKRVSIPEQACGTSNQNPKAIPGIVPRRHVPFPPRTNPTPPVRRQHAAAAVVIVRPIVKSGPHAGEEKTPVKKTPMVKVIVMEISEVREGVTGKSVAGDDMRRKHLTAEATARKSVATKARVAGEAAKSAMPTSAAVTTTTATAAMTASAAMRDSAGPPYRRAERNGRGEPNTRRLQPHEASLRCADVVCSLVAFPRGSPDCDRGKHAMPRTIPIKVPVAPATKTLASFGIEKWTAPLKLLMRQFLT